MDTIMSNVETYGLSILVIAICIILLIGVLKVCKAFNWIKSKEIKKTVYYICDIILAFGGSAIYFAIFKQSFSVYIAYAFAELGTVTMLYSFYEYVHIRKFVSFVLSALIKWLKGNPDNKIAKQLKSLGLDENSIAKVQTLVEGEKAKVETETNVEQKTTDVKTIPI